MAEQRTKRPYTKRNNQTEAAPQKPKEYEAPVAEVIETAPPAQPMTDTTVQPAPQPINMVVEQKAPPVKILYIDSVIPNNQIPIGGGRFITGSGRIFSVSMEHFEGEFMTPLTMKLIDNRKFIVLSGLSAEQRQQYNCFYKEGEVVRDEGMFDHLLDCDVDSAAEIFELLCPEHQQLVATRFITAYFERHDNRVTRDKVERLNKISKKTDPEGLFTPIVKEINEKSV